MLHTCILSFGPATWFSSDDHTDDLVLGVQLPDNLYPRFSGPFPAGYTLTGRTTILFRPSADQPTRLFLYNEANHCVAELRTRPNGLYRFLITLEARDPAATTPLREDDPSWLCRHVLVTRVKSLNGRKEPLWRMGASV